MNIPQEFEDVFSGADLTEDEVRTLNWLVGWERRTVENLRSAIQKAKSHAISTLQTENEELRKMYQQEKSVCHAVQSELERVKRERDAAIDLLHNWEQYGQYLASMGFTVPNSWQGGRHGTIDKVHMGADPYSQGIQRGIEIARGWTMEAAAMEVVRCRECRHSSLPSAFTQRYGEPGVLSCHYGPCNKRNVRENDFCSNGQRKEPERHETDGGAGL